ncbi:MAG: hypothetical protein KJ666_04215 [Bacteroidetes bacterium]|nr:hypothetical protein [Bacteroidota bacterium]MBU2584227.1 hypothetical protein [Bacteroidota bacterium]
MNKKKINSLAKIFKWITVFLFVCFIGSVIIIFIDLFPIYPLITRLGLTNFFNYFDPSIKIGAFFTGALAILITLERMYQTSENYQLNNYFKHKEEFIKEFKDNRFFQEISALTDRDIEFEVRNLYNKFYYKSPNNFTPYLNKETKDQFENFIKSVKESSLDKIDYDLFQFPKEDLIKISEINHWELKSLVNSMNSRVIPSMRSIAKNNGDNIADRINKFVYLNEIFWSGLFYEFLLLFNGANKHIWNNFPINFINYREICFYDDAKLRVKESLHNQQLKPTASVGQSI